MGYAYYSDHKDPTKFIVRDPSKNEWRGVVRRTEDDKWESEKGGRFDTREEAANDNAPTGPPVKLGTIQY